MFTVETSANIKQILQKELFNESSERVLAACAVTKTYKKKKTCYLCIVSKPPPNVNDVTICQVKQPEKGEYKRKRSWSLADVKCVDGKNESVETHEFDIQLDKTYKWYVINLHERQNFLVVLYRQIYKNFQTGRAEFRNIPSTWLVEKSPEKITSKEPTINAGNEENSEDEAEDFHALTEKEVNDLNKLISDNELAITNAELFIEQMTKQLHDLDDANLESVLTSEKQVDKLMSHIDTAISAAEKLEEKLDTYDGILLHVGESMEKMGEKNAMIEVVNRNNFKLMNELYNIITQIDIPYEHQVALSETDLKTPEGREAAIAAGKCLRNALNCDIDPALIRLTAVQDQRKRFEKWKAKFSQTINRYLNNLFIHLGNDLGDNLVQLNELVLPNHQAAHQELVVYTELMHWTKAMDRKAYDGLTKVYTTSLSKIYDRDLKNFFGQARLRVSTKFSNSREDLNASTSSTKSKHAGTKQVSVPYGLLGANRELWSSGVDLIDREKFDMILERVLAELEPIALQEQMFCINFFQLDVISPTSKNTQTTLDAPFERTPEKSESDVSFPQKRIDRQINEEVRKMMMALFGVLETELINFVQCFEKLDNFYSMYALVRLTQHVMSAQDTHSFLSMTFASALVHVKRNFDRFMQQQVQSIKEAKVPKRSKCGILPYVENFEEFARATEEIFKKSERRTDMDKWYVQLTTAIFEHIPIHAMEHSKTPNQVIKMENFHHMQSVLAQLKVPVLEALKKEAKVRYNDALKAYVIKYFGRPLEKLNLFFEGVQQKVSQGVKETEISYQMAYSKQELRKVISHYPAREVKKGLENLYKKVEKHLCEQENLLQVVWHAMQEEFIAQYNFLEERIQKCYAGAMITLDFTIHEILTFFSDIARSH